MVAYTYSRVAALNFNTTPASVAKSATGSVYAVADTTFTTPLNLTLVVGGVTTTSVSADANGFFPDFTVNDRTSVVWKQNGSAFTSVLTTTDPMPGPKGDTGSAGAKGDKGDPGDLSPWQENTYYPLNKVVSTPTGDLVKVTTAHTSGASYDATKFGPIAIQAGGLTGTVPESVIPARLSEASLSDTIATGVEDAATDPTGVIKATYADAQDLSHPTRLDFIRRGKGGTIGTGGKPVIAFRFDHYVDATLANIWPLFVARGLPAGIGLISRPANPVDPTAASWATVKNMIAQGNEVWSHSATHSDPGNTWAGMVDEIQNSRIELEAQGLTVMGWQMAGTATTNPNYGSNFTTAAQFATPAGKLLMANYGLIEAYAGGARRVLPTYGCYGLDHVTVESLTLTILKGDVDRAISLGLGVEFMIHSNRIGAPGYLSLADFTALLDYVVAKRDAGQIEVLTPSGLAFADPTHSRRMDLIYGGDFETQTTAAPSPWSLPAGGTIETTGGATGSRFLRIASTGASVGQGNSLVKTLNMNGFAFEIRGMIRYPSDLTAGRVTAVDNTNASTPVIITQRDITPTAANTWQPFRVPFVMPKDTATFKLELRRLSTSGTTVDYDDVHVYAV